MSLLLLSSEDEDPTELQAVMPITFTLFADPMLIPGLAVEMDIVFTLTATMVVPPTTGMVLAAVMQG